MSIKLVEILCNGDSINITAYNLMQELNSAIQNAGLNVTASIEKNNAVGANAGDVSLILSGADKNIVSSISLESNNSSLNTNIQLGTVAASSDFLNQVTNGVDNIAMASALDLSDHLNAEGAIQLFDNAIGTVSTERARLGAYENRLEHTINNLGTSSENLTAAESRIRDVDMAKAMMQFSKENILTQAAQAMLLQADQEPQLVLQLLR